MLQRPSVDTFVIEQPNPSDGKSPEMQSILQWRQSLIHARYYSESVGEEEYFWDQMKVADGLMVKLASSYANKHTTSEELESSNK